MYRLIFYEAAGKSGVIAAKAFDVGEFAEENILLWLMCSVSNLVHSALEAIQSCNCVDGCINCGLLFRYLGILLIRTKGIDGPYCKEGNEVSSKVGAQVIIRGLLGMPVNIDALPAIQHTYDPEMDTIAHAVVVPNAENVLIEHD